MTSSPMPTLTKVSGSVVPTWFKALQDRFPHWCIRFSPNFAQDPTELGLPPVLPEGAIADPDLHLGVSVRSFRAERLSDFVAAVLLGDQRRALKIRADLANYPLAVTRDLSVARAWLREHARGTERYGLVASSNGLRLKPEGIHMKAKISTINWFLDDRSDVRSSLALEDAASEFEIQGLELGWVGICWDANLRYEDGWSPFKFSGKRWEPGG